MSRHSFSDFNLCLRTKSLYYFLQGKDVDFRASNLMEPDRPILEKKEREKGKNTCRDFFPLGKKNLGRRSTIFHRPFFLHFKVNHAFPSLFNTLYFLSSYLFKPFLKIYLPPPLSSSSLFHFYPSLLNFLSQRSEGSYLTR